MRFLCFLPFLVFAYLAGFAPASLAPAPAAASDAGVFDFDFEELAPGVWTAIRTDGARIPVMGNATFVITESGVIVFDGGGTASMAEQVLRKIRAETDLPITHIGISHWHGDHHFGIHVLRDAFPAAEIVAHRFTRDAMLGSPISYIDNYPTFVERNRPAVAAVVETGKDGQGNDVDPSMREQYGKLLNDIEFIGEEFLRSRVTVPTLTIEDRLTLHRGERTVEFVFLGVGNTAGDLLMWLPEEKIVATGDLVVHPTPYLYNVPPRAWAKTMRALNALEYEILVPGHGAVQRDTGYVDLLIELAETTADQRDAFLAEGMPEEEVIASLDFSEFEPRFSGGNPYLANRFRVWGAGPFRYAALKALTGEPMVAIGPRYPKEEAGEAPEGESEDDADEAGD